MIDVVCPIVEDTIQRKPQLERNFCENVDANIKQRTGKIAAVETRN